MGSIRRRRVRRCAAACALVLACVAGHSPAAGLIPEAMGDQAALRPVAALPTPVTGFAAIPASEWIGPTARLDVPVLMYHQFGEAPTAEAAPYFTATSDFVDQLRYLQANGYHAVTLQQVYDCWYGVGTLPSHPVVISIDDGSDPVFDFVAPMLQSMGWPGVLSLITGDRPGRQTMGASEVRALVAAGWEIDSHSLNHPDLTTLSPEDLARQMTLSRRLLQEQFGVPANFFCYPYGKYDDRVIEAARQAGYAGALCTRNGLASSRQPFAMKRRFVRGGMSLAEFATLLR